MSLFGSFRGLSIINSFIIHKLFSRVTSLKIISGEPRKQVDLILLAVYLLCDQTTKSWFYNEAFTNNINNAGLVIVVNLPSRLWCATNYCELKVYVQSRISQYFTKKFSRTSWCEWSNCMLFIYVRSCKARANYFRCFARFVTICTIEKTWETPMKEFLSVKLQASTCNFIKSSTLPWVFFTFF